MAFNLSNVKLWLTLALFVSVLLNVHAQDGYVSDSVVFKSKVDTVQIGATITKPRKGSKLPAIVLVSGTGKQDRDGTMGNYKLFAILADYLTRQGYVVLRMDDRGVGKTTGVYEEATTADFAADALAAHAFLRSYKGVDGRRVGLLGHSEGAAACAIAASRETKVAFLISLAGLAMNGYDALIKQNIDLVENSPLPDREKKRYHEINRLMFMTAYTYAGSTEMEGQLNRTYTEWKIKDSLFMTTQDVEFDHFRFPIYSYAKQAIGPWYRYFVRYDAKATLAAVKVPVLAINGDKDLMVACRENLRNWKEFTAAAGNLRVTTHALPGLGHLLRCETCPSTKSSTPMEVMDMEVLKIIADWLLAET